MCHQAGDAQRLDCWVMESPTHKLLDDHPSIDQIIVVPKGWMKKPIQWLKLRKRLRNMKFDIVLDPQGLTKSSMLGSTSGAPLRIGFDGRTVASSLKCATTGS